MANVIRLGDPTSHGGKVESVSAKQFTASAIPVARLGDKCTCPLHGPGTIVEGDQHNTIDGIPVAYEGHKTSCGAVLVSTTTNFEQS